MSALRNAHAVALAILLSSAFNVFSGESKASSSVEIELKTQELVVFTSALREFQKAGGNPSNYSVLIRSMGQNFEVVFFPNRTDGDAGIRGGKTGLGREISYLVSLDGVVIRTSYAR